jgi:hypothetical protein
MRRESLRAPPAREPSCLIGSRGFTSGYLLSAARAAKGVFKQLLSIVQTASRSASSVFAEDALPAFLTIILIPLTFSITQGIL